RLGTLEDFQAGAPRPARSAAPSQFGAGYKIVRFFDGGGFNFAQLTYYRDPNGGRGYLYFEDGPDLSGDHTPYNQTWLYAKPDSETKLRALLKQLGAKVDDTAPAPSAANANASVEQPSQATGAQPAKAGDQNAFSPALIALAVGAAGLL